VTSVPRNVKCLLFSLTIVVPSALSIVVVPAAAPVPAGGTFTCTSTVYAKATMRTALHPEDGPADFIAACV